MNPELAMPVMNFLHITTNDISPGGRLWQEFQKDMMEANDNANSVDEDAICTIAKGMFGPKGVVAPNMMIPSGD